MQILAITSQKGGVGKTTLSMNLAVAAALDGVPTLVLDLDPQASAAEYYDRRKMAGHNEQPQVISIQAARLGPALQAALDDGFKLVIIDTPPNVGVTMAEIIKAGDLIMIPVRPSGVDLAAIEASIRVVKATDRPGIVVMNEVRPRGELKDDTRDIITERYEFPVAKQTIGNRVAFVYAGNEGAGVLETEPSSKAAEEITALWKFTKAALKKIRAEDAAGVRKEAVNG